MGRGHDVSVPDDAAAVHGDGLVVALCEAPDGEAGERRAEFIVDGWEARDEFDAVMGEEVG